MKQNILTVTYFFGLIGILTWCLTLFLRGTNISTMQVPNFILGIMPNISAAWFFIWICELIYTRTKREYTFKVATISTFIIFTLGLASEIYHAMFLNSPFDLYDIIATICAGILYLLIFYFINK